MTKLIKYEYPTQRIYTVREYKNASGNSVFLAIWHPTRKKKDAFFVSIKVTPLVSV